MVGPVVAGIVGSAVGGVIVYGLQLAVEGIKEEMNVRENDDKPENAGIRSWLVKLEVEVKEMMFELEWLRGLVQNAAAFDVANDKQMRACAAELREIVCRVEDCIESHSADIKSGDIKRLEEFANQVSNVNKSIGQLKKRYEEYGVKDLVGKTSPFFEIQQQLVQSYRHGTEHDIVPNYNLPYQIPPFVATQIKSDSVPVFSICGMSGSGKTTLAKLSHRDPSVKQHFELSAWVYVPKKFNRRDIWESILFQISSPDELKHRDKIAKKRDEEVAKMIYRKLKEKRGLVVLDDIRNIDDWRIISAAFPRWENTSPPPTQSKILLTSCNQGVAEIVHPGGGILELPPLDDKNNWELFLKKMKGQSLGDARKETIAREMVNYCQGLPMGTVAVANVLRSNNFEAVHQDFLSYLRKGRDDKGQKLFDALASSYYTLPQHLQPCFLYMGLFPRGYDIPVERLINLWVAEGIVMPKLGQAERLEDVAHRYLSDLVQRGMIQANRAGGVDSYGRANIEKDSIGRIKTCSLHNLMRDLCFLLAKRERFFECIDVRSKTLVFGANGKSAPYEPIRRIALYLDNLVEKVDGEYPLARSIIGFPDENKNAHMNHYALKYLVTKFTFLRVLDLDRVKGFILQNFHKFYEDLRHLRYLNLDCSCVNNFSTHHLTPTLLTLIFSGDTKVQISGDLRKLKSLRHLYLPTNYELSAPNDRLQLGNLRDLQTLMNLNVSTVEVGDLANLPSLRELGVAINDDVALRSFDDLIKTQVFNSLQSLSTIFAQRLKGQGILGQSIMVRYPQLSVVKMENGAITYSIA